MPMRPLDFDGFVDANANGLLRTAFLIVGDLHDAEDLVVAGHRSCRVGSAGDTVGDADADLRLSV
jgi:hypothetical protein